MFNQMDDQGLLISGFPKNNNLKPKWKENLRNFKITQLSAVYELSSD